MRTDARLVAALLYAAVTAALLFVWWPLGVLAGAIGGTVAVLVVGARMQADWERAPFARAGEREAVDTVRGALADLKERLGDNDPDFARAARLVVATQRASAGRLRRGLAVPRSRARALLDELEQQRLVGPHTGPLPRQVLVPRESLQELDRALQTV